MFEGVIQRFLHRHKQVVADFGGQGPVGQLRGHIQAAAYAGVLEIVLRILEDVVGEVIERVVLRIDRPHDFIHSLRDLADRPEDVPDMRFVGVVVLRLAVHQFRHHGHLGQPGAHIIMQVGGDLNPQPFDVAKPGDARPIEQREHQRGGHSKDRPKPPRLPIMRHEHERQRGAGFVPHTVIIAGDNPEEMLPGSDAVVRDGAAGAGVNPLGIDAFQQIPEAVLLGRLKAQGRVMDFQPAPGWRDREAQRITGRQRIRPQ